MTAKRWLLFSMAVNIGVPLVMAMFFRDWTIWPLMAGLIVGLLAGCVLGRIYEIAKRMEGVQNGKQKAD